MSRVPYVRARLRRTAVIAATGAVVAAGLVIPSSAFADAPPTSQNDVLSGGSLSADGWSGPAVDPANGFDYSETSQGTLTASNYGTNGDITQLESPVTAEAGEPGYTDAAYDTYHIAFTIDGNAQGGANAYVAQPGVVLEMDADEGGNRAGGGLYFSVPSDGMLEIDNFSSTDPFGNTWNGVSTQIPFGGPVTIDYTVQFVAGGNDIVTVLANNQPILTGAGTYEGYSYSNAVGGDGASPATVPDAQKVDQVLFRGTTHVFDPNYPTDGNAVPWTPVAGTVAAPGAGFNITGLEYGAMNSDGPAFASTSTVSTDADQIANYEDAADYNSWHIGSNDDPTDTYNYFNVLSNGDVQLNDPTPTDGHGIQLLHGIATADQPHDLYALVAGGLAWNLTTAEQGSYQIALTDPAVPTTSHFTTLHSEVQVESEGLNVVRLSDPWVSTHQIGTIPANTEEPLGVLLAALEPGVAADPDDLSGAITESGLNVIGFGVSSEAISGQTTTTFGPVYFGGKKYDFSPASTLTVHKPTISGTEDLGGVLTASATTEPLDATQSYQWLRNGVAISGATSKSYTIVTKDLTTKLSVKVTGTLTGYTTASATSAASPTIRATSITTSGAVGVTGTAQVGVTLHLTKPTFTPAATSYAYQWLANGAAISGATQSTYKVTASKIGLKITVAVTANRANFTSLIATSAKTASVIPGVLEVSGTPIITGTAKVGKTLKISSKGWTANGVATTAETRTYFWFVSDGSGALTLSDIIHVGESDVLVIPKLAKGQVVSVYVVGTEDGYNTVTSPTSAYTATVQ